MKSLVALPLLLSLAAVAQTSTKPETKRALPRMTVLQDYVTVEGHWEPREIKGDDIEITCVRLDAHRFFGSQKGYCLVAYAFSSYDGHPMVKTDYLDILNWGNTRVIAGHNKTWEWTECESQTYVIDFPTNTVTMTSVLNKADKRCVDRYRRIDALHKAETKALPKDIEVFTLVPGVADMAADKQANPFLKD